MGSNRQPTKSEINRAVQTYFSGEKKLHNLKRGGLNCKCMPNAGFSGRDGGQLQVVTVHRSLK